MTPLPQRITVLVVQPDERSHAPVREILSAIERPRCEVRWVRSAQAARAALDAHGVRSHIDDFGTGASSLRLLHGFPGDAVKIHRALVIGMGREAGAFEIVKTLVDLAHNLGLDVIAEGVETAAQLEHLKLLGCEFAQGFHISAPLRPEDATTLLHSVKVAR